MDIAPWVWVIVGVVVVVLLVVFLVTGRRRRAMEQKRDESNREKAAEMRRKAEEVELDAREKEARASRARADAEQAQVEAARLKQEAEQKAGDARSLRDDVARQTEKANAIDPDVRQDEDRESGPGGPGATGHAPGPGPARADDRRRAPRGSRHRRGIFRTAGSSPRMPAAEYTPAFGMDDTPDARGRMPSLMRARGDSVMTDGDGDRRPGREPAQAEDLRRRRERAGRDAPRSGI